MFEKKIGDIGATIIARGLKHATSLSCLNLGIDFVQRIGYCRIKGKGIIEIGKALMNHKSLTKLILGRLI